MIIVKIPALRRVVTQLKTGTPSVTQALSIMYHHLLTKIELLQSISLVSVAMQTYRVDVGVAQVIIGNEVLLKCDIPSFAADFVSVNAWIDSEGHSYSRDNHMGIKSGV